MTKATRLIFAFVLIVAAAPAAADRIFARRAPVLIGNLDFLRDAPGTYFNQADTALFKKTTIAALNEAKDGETRTWSNSDTGSSGKITIVRTLAPSAGKCREVQITNRAAGRTHTQSSVFCHEVDKDQWRMRPGTK